MSSNHHEQQLERGLSLTQATAINMIDMVGIGPFVTVSLIVGLMNGPLSIAAWLLGALLAYMDGFVWAELGARYPEAGGSYVFLQKLFKGQWGKLMAFLFIWQTVIQAPLVIASGSIGFSDYLTYLIPSLTPIQMKMISGGLVLLLMFLLYRDIKSVGKISILFGIITVGTIIWIITAGIGKTNLNKAFDFHFETIRFNTLFFAALGQASLKSVYSYLGYYNVCHLGGEIKNPAKNIPRSIFISITGIAILYLCMQTVLIGVLPTDVMKASKYAVSLYFEYLYGTVAGSIATVLILCIALASLFSVMLGYSRVPYAAAVNGDFFPVFGRLHPRLRFPHVSLLVLGSLAFVFSLLFKMKDVISAIIAMRILIQFVSQAVGVIAWHRNRPKENRPFTMPLFPVPAIISIIIWLFIFFTGELRFILFAIGIILSGMLLFVIKSRKSIFPGNNDV